MAINSEQLFHSTVKEEPDFWRAKEILLLLAIYFGSGFLFPEALNIMLTHIVKAANFTGENLKEFLFPHVLGGSYLITSLFLLALLFYSVVIVHRQKFLKSLKISLPTLPNIIRAVYVAILLLGTFLVAAMYLKPKGVVNPAMKLLNHGAIGMFWFVLVVIIIAPLFEEVFFRGYIYEGFKKSWGRGSAIILVSLLFAGLHLPKSIVVFATLFVYSLAFVLLKEISSTLLTAVVCHMVINSSPLMIYLVLRYGFNVVYKF